jgi:mannose/cellobiose epimerase-like protein (N-acyl-D-glucosamine 2-epimerase family)
VQSQVKMGEEAQSLDALLSMYELTHNRAYLTLVHNAAGWLSSSSLHDRINGGYFFSIDYNGAGLQSAYKESRQAWMLALFEHLNRLEPGRWTSQVTEMLAVVKDKLWAAVSDGYVYRVTPQFTVYVNHQGAGNSAVTERWVTSEAMDIACQVLEG